MRCNCYTKKGYQCLRKANKPDDNPFFCNFHYNGCNKLKNIRVNDGEIGIIKKDINKRICYFSIQGLIEIKKIKRVKQLDCLQEITPFFFDWHECLIMKKFNHDNIVKIRDCGVNDKESIYIITERYNGDIREFPFDQKLSQSCHCQILSALEILQKNKIVHRDIHVGNILWSKTEKNVIENVPTFGIRFLLSDFDMSICLDPFSELRLTPKTKKKFTGRRLIKKENGILELKNLSKTFSLDKAFLENSLPIEFYVDMFSLIKCIKKLPLSKQYKDFLSKFPFIPFDRPLLTSEIFFLAEKFKEKALEYF